MKNLNLLKTIIDILYVCGVITLIILIGMFLAFNFGWLDESFSIKLNEYENISDRYQIVNWLGPFMFVGLAFYVLILKRFSQIIKLFFEENFFSDATYIKFKQIGYYFVISPILLKVPPVILATFLNPGVTFSLPVGYDSFLFLIAIGLFFMALSEIFKKAMILKEDSELAI